MSATASRRGTVADAVMRMNDRLKVRPAKGDIGEAPESAGHSGARPRGGRRLVIDPEGILRASIVNLAYSRR